MTTPTLPGFDPPPDQPLDQCELATLAHTAASDLRVTWPACVAFEDRT